MNRIAARRLVLGFWSILFSILAPLVDGVAYGQAERNDAHDRHDLSGQCADTVQDPGSGYVVVAHGSKGLGGWQYAALGLALQ